MRRILLFPIACVVLLASCAAPRVITNNVRTTQLRQLGYAPLALQKTSGDSRYSGRFLVNGQPVQLLIDSGANSTDLDAILATKLGIVPDRSLTVVSRGALGRPITSQVGLGSLTAGPVTANPFPFMLAPPTDRHTATSRYDGQIGLDALSGLGALIDLSDGHLWVPGDRAVNAAGGEIHPLGPSQRLGFDALRLNRAGRLPHLILEGDWNGNRLSWVVDTGAEVTVLSSHTVRRHRIATVASHSKIVDASGDNAPVRVATLNNVVFGRLIVREFQVAVTPLKTVREHFRDSRGRPVDGIVGMDFLEESGALLDSASRLLYIGHPEIHLAPPSSGTTNYSVSTRWHRRR